MKKYFLTLFGFFLIISALAQSANDYFSPLKFRNIGPFRGGRAVCATGVVGDPTTYYMGSTGGGLWKTEDAGQHWRNVSDGFFEMGSVGAVAVSESNPNVVYCGMGEHAPRGVMTSYGDGVYKSIDGGRTWKKMGLEKTQHIARIVINPHNPDIVLVAAQGALFAPNNERGIYKTTDGGKSWTQVLFVNNLTGCNELSMDMNNPQIIYATMWQYQRKPWIVISGGEGSGVYKSMDGGDTWEKIEKGLPKEKGKMAISVSRANSQRVYAVIEGDSDKDHGGLFVSDNGGKDWHQASSDHRLTQRAWYYIEVFADPMDEHTVYVMSAQALRSIDDGKTWERLGGTHGDFHDLWINPLNNKNMIISNDGGSAISFDTGGNWSSQDNIPTAQFYRISVDNLFPYNLYGGQQDNTTVRIPSLVLGSWDISEHDWTSTAGGESAFLAFDPDNPKWVMGGSYLGTIEIMDMDSRGSTQIMEAPIQYLGRAARDMKYLFNWNAPIIRSVHEPNTFYHGAQLVLRTRDNGKTWREVSPDLTRNMDEKQGKGGGPFTVEAVGAENYGTLAYIIESPIEKGVIYTGSDDGYVYVTRNNCESWENITPKGLQECLINSVEVSPKDPGTAYIATTRYKFNDYTPAIYKTTNYGKTWTNISTGIPNGAFTRVVREDPVDKNILYAGTEKGIYISWNAGANWERFQLNMPVSPITDLKIHNGDLLVATSGRGFWILDDMSVIEQHKAGISTLYKPEDAVYGFWGSPLNGDSEDFEGSSDLSGINPANGVVIYYELPKDADSAKLSMTIQDKNGNVIRSYSSQKDESEQVWGGGPPAKKVLPARPGLNRFVWDMRHETMSGVPNVYMEANFRGHVVSPGEYTIKLAVDGKEYTTSAKILDNPLYKVSADQYAEYDKTMSEMESNLTKMHDLINQLYDAQKQLRDLVPDLEDASLKSEGNDLIEALKAWDEDMIQRKSTAYDDVENYPNKFTAEYMFLINATESSIPSVNQPSKDRRKELDEQWNGLNSRANDFLTKSIPAYNKKLWDAGIGAIKIN